MLSKINIKRIREIKAPAELLFRLFFHLSFYYCFIAFGTTGSSLPYFHDTYVL